MVELDRWVLGRATQLQNEIVAAYDNYEFHNVVHKLMNFCTTELGGFYLDIIKDRQYTAKEDSVARRSCQTAIYLIAEAMTRWMAPVLSFTAQEVWQALPVVDGEERDEFVFTDVWFDGLVATENQGEFSNDFWDQIIQVRGAVNKALETARKEKTVGKALEASVTLHATAELAELLGKLEDELRFVLITSNATINVVASAPESAIETDVEGLWLNVGPSTGTKCDRCWHVTDDIGHSETHPELCGRCITNVDGDGELRKFA